MEAKKSKPRAIPKQDKKIEEQIETITVNKLSDMTRWFKKNHKTKSKLRIVLLKKHLNKDSPSHNAQIREAIRFGWIDTTLKAVDENSYSRNFVKRTTKSTWSDNTLGYAKELIEQKLMTEEGLKYYHLGLNKPSYDHDIPKNPKMPPELKAELDKKDNKQVKEIFEKYSPSRKKMLYRWLLSAKTSPTREKRVRSILDTLNKAHSRSQQ